MPGTRLRIVCAALLLLAACSGSGDGTMSPPPPPAPPPPPPPPAAVASVAITGNPAPLIVGATAQLTATPRDASGNALTGRAVTWSTSAAGFATVNNTGLVTAIAPGSATITATSEGISGTAPITVVPVPVASIALTSPKVAFQVGETSQYAAQPLDAQGNPLAGRTVNWSSSQPGLATVSATGLVTALTPGSAVITAANGTVTATVSISVAQVPVATVTISAPTVSFAVGDASQYSAQEKDAQGQVLAGRTATWNSTQPSVATVSASGLVTAVGVGTTAITATSEGVTSAPTTVTVAPSAVLIEQRVLAQQGLAVALASTVLQSQLYTLLSVAAQADDNGCTALPGGGAFKYFSSTATIPFTIGFFFDAACVRMYMQETVTSFSGNTVNNASNFHLIANALYTGPTGTPLGSISFDESANNITFGGGNFTGGTVNGLGTYTPPAGSATVHLGLNCNLRAGGHNIGICQGGIQQDFTGLGAAYGSVATLGVDSSNAGVVTFTGTSVLTSGAIGGLTLAQPSATVMVVNGGAAYGSTTDAGGAANFSLFPPTPTGWTITDAGHDEVFTINVVDNTVRNLVATLKRISTGATLATITLDQSGTGTITYSDGSSAPVTNWMLSQ